MSRVALDLDGRRVLTFGYDAPFGTYYAQLWDRGFDPDFDMGAPAKVAGYHEAERIEPLAGEYGPYPLDAEGLDEVLEAWDVCEEARDRVRVLLALGGKGD